MTGVFTLRQIKPLLHKFDIQVVYLRNFNPRRKIIDRYRIEGIDVTSISIPYASFTFTRIRIISLRLYSFLVKVILSNTKFDLIHAVGGAFSGIVSVNLKLNKKVIVQYNGSDVNVSLKLMKNSFWIQQCVHKVDRFIFVSSNLKMSLQNDFKVKDEYCSVVYRGVNLSNFEYNNVETNKTKILFLGGFSPKGFPIFGINQKGGETLLKAWSSIEDKSRLELTFGGNNITDTILKEFHHIFSSIRVIGKLTPKQVIEELRQSNLVIIPSLSEGLPNVLFESMATGKAIIASRVGGIPEILTHLKGGILIEPGSVDQLKNSIIQLMEDKRKIIEYGKYNRIFVEKNLGSEKSMTQLSRIYMDIYKNN